MTKEDVLKIFPNATAENIANILNCVDTEVAVAKKSRISDEDLTKLKEKAINSRKWKPRSLRLMKS